MEEEFLKLKKFFEELNKNKAVDYFDNLPFIRTEWMYSESIDINIIKSVIAEIMTNINPRYSEFARRKITILKDATTKEEYYEKRYQEDIQGFKVIIQESDHRLILQAIGADEHTKLNISDRLLPKDNQSKKQVLTITLDELKKMIAEKLDEIQLAENLKSLKLDMKAKRDFINKFKNDEKRYQRNIEIVQNGLKQLFANIVKYYRYLIEYSAFLEEENLENNMTYIIEQRKDENNKKQGKRDGARPRVNDIIDFMDRSDALKEFKPAKIKVLGEKNEETGEIISNSYTLFVYTSFQENTLNANKKGWIFVCEPQRGDRATRLIYLTREEFEKFNIGENEDRISIIAKNYLDMSQHEFDESVGTLTLRHTTQEAFIGKMRFYIIGDKPVNKNVKGFVENLRKLYKNPELVPKGYKPRLKRGRKELLDAISDIPESQIDRMAQNEIDTNTLQTQK